MTELWLSRARLRRDASIATLAPMLLPDRDDDRVSNGHRLMCSLFAWGGDQRPRDFLWREDTSGWFYTLSVRPPPENHALFEIDPPKRFAPSLEPGDRLRFSLRANPTVSRPQDGFRTQSRDPTLKPSRKTAHDDIVMHALHALPGHARADARQVAIQTAGRVWLEGQGARCGFALAPVPDPNNGDVLSDALRIDGYRVLRPPRPRKAGQMRIGVLDFDGVLTVTDPQKFQAALAVGFGRAKAYGCGLMLIARVAPA
jgi:CRISPR system Cascade subunit CasE